jgi:hypothetical protein
MNNRILGILGSALLIIGVFLPILSLMGVVTFSYFDFIRLDPGTFFTGILILLLGIVSMLLTLAKKYKLLILTGIIALGMLAFDFYRIRSGMDSVAGGSGSTPPEVADSVGLGWGFYVMVIGAIALIVAGVMKSTAPATPANWGGAQPPPYPPGR